MIFYRNLQKLAFSLEITHASIVALKNWNNFLLYFEGFKSMSNYESLEKLSNSNIRKLSNYNVRMCVFISIQALIFKKKKSHSIS